ncbi:MAG: thioredoxin family protein [Candidatus Dormibacteraeota bacterium]|nr:thioredoxin family protein [Candidatus Dormibacteraeota bacterium]
MKRAALVLASITLLTACATLGPTAAAPSAGTLTAQSVASELVVGEQRVPLGILDHNTPVSDAAVHIRSFYLGSKSAEARGESAAPFKGDGLQGAGIYAGHLTFDKPGNWRLDVTATRPNGDHAVIQVPINVIAKPIVPGVGQPAPASNNPTAATVSDVSLIDTGQPPDDMHQVSIAQAIADHKPTLVVFASPAYCTSQLCGPEVKVVQSLEPAYRDRLTFIHVEIYTNYKPDPTKRQPAQTVLDWRLQTEPWIFLIDAGGTIRTRIEGAAGADEVKAAIDQLLK